jgi:hypothetical protein
MLRHSTDDLWYSIMDFDQYAVPIKNLEKGQSDESSSRDTPVSRFGALFAAALLRLPGATYYRLIEEYPLSITELTVVSPNLKRKIPFSI